MRHRLKNILSSEFNKNVFIISRGTVISQILLIAATPLLTRLYSPESFGKLAVFTSIYSIVLGISTLKYELSVLLPKSEKQAVQLVQLTILSSAILTICFSIVIGILSISGYIALDYVYYFIPFILIIGATNSALINFFSRMKDFQTGAITGIINSLGNVVFCFILFCFHESESIYLLTIAYIIGIIFSFLYLLFQFLKKYSSLWEVEVENLWSLALEYKRFPKYVVFTSLLGLLSYQIFPILIEKFFTTEDVGYYSLANRFLFVPSILIGGAIGEVFRVEFSKNLNSGGDNLEFFKKTLQKMAILGILIFIPLYFIAPLLFEVFLGSQYAMSGQFASYLSIGIMGIFLIQPFQFVFIALNRMKVLIVFQIVFAVIPVVAVITGDWLVSIFTTFKIYSMLCIVISGFFMFFVTNSIQRLQPGKVDYE